jgi:predicted TIM-barrel fold metal-dependent hydrolase
VDHADPVAETAWLQAVADDPASGGLPSGIVAYADLASPNVDDVLARHCAHANMRGIRDMLNFEPDTPRFCFAARGDLMQDAGWRAGYGRLRAHGLSFDLQLWWQQMADATRLAADFGDIQMILNHTGMPRLFDPDYLAGWRKGMRELASAPNVAVKISGLCMFDRGWSTDSIRPFVEQTIECFGVDRCMFASNFPVESLMSTYAALWDAFSEITGDYSETERAKLFHDNAVRIYRLD